MALLSSFNEDRPVSYIRGYPIYCATLLTIAYGVGILLTAVLHQTIDLFGLFAFLPSRSILQGQVWQIFTYSFVNLPSFFILFSLFFLYIAAVEVEKYIRLLAITWSRLASLSHSVPYIPVCNGWVSYPCAGSA